MMTSLGLGKIFTLVLCIVYKTQGDDLYQTLVLSTSTSASLPILKTTSSFTETDEATDIEEHTVQPEVQWTQQSGHSPELPSSHSSPVSHRPETSPAPQLPQSANSDISHAIKETNSIDDIFTDNDQLFNLSEGTTLPKEENIIKDVPSATTQSSVMQPQVTPYEEKQAIALLEETSEVAEDNPEGLGLEPWKIGVISVIVFLAIEAVILTVYCLICRKRRRAVIIKSYEQDSEAGETINVESNDNTVTSVEATNKGSSYQSTLNGIEQQETQQPRGDMPDNKSTTV